MTRSFRIAGCLTALIFSTLPLLAIAQDIDLVDVTLIDGTGSAARPHVSISIRGGKIDCDRRSRAGVEPLVSVESS